MFVDLVKQRTTSTILRIYSFGYFYTAHFFQRYVEYIPALPCRQWGTESTDMAEGCGYECEYIPGRLSICPSHASHLVLARGRQQEKALPALPSGALPCCRKRAQQRQRLYQLPTATVLSQSRERSLSPLPPRCQSFSLTHITVWTQSAFHCGM